MSFEISRESRLDPRTVETLPDYYASSRAAREALSQTVETDGWPEAPKAKKIEDFFNAAEETVTKRWSGAVRSLLSRRSSEWLVELPEAEDLDSVRRILSDQDELEEKIKIRQFGVLSPLREHMPGAWRELILLSSERQLASLQLMHHWVEGMNEDAISSLGLSRPELEIFLELGMVLGKYVDQGYLKQVEMADIPGGKNATPLGEEATRVYDFIDKDSGGDIKAFSYAEAFPAEIPAVSRRLRAFSKRIQQLTDSNRLPESYALLPGFLSELAEAYGSTETSTENLNEMWDKVSHHSAEVALSGCPIVILHQFEQTVADDANKTDIEIRLGIRTAATIETEAAAGPFRSEAQSLLDSIIEANPRAVAEYVTVPDAVVTVQPFAFGPNLYWKTRGQESDVVHVHQNAVTEVASSQEIPLLARVTQEQPDTQAYGKAASLETYFHEAGHTILYAGDPAVDGRIGKSSEAKIVDELKAETVGMMVLQKAMNENRLPKSLDIRTQFLAKMGAITDYLANKDSSTIDGAQYYYPAVAIVSELLDRGILQKNGDIYRIGDEKEGVKALAEMGSAILQLYADEDTTPDSVKKFYTNDIQAKAGREDVQRFISIARQGAETNTEVTHQP